MRQITGDLEGKDARQALAVQAEGGEVEAVIFRNAKMADVEQALRLLRTLGLKDAQLGRLFNYKGSAKGLAQHVKVLASRLN